MTMPGGCVRSFGGACQEPAVREVRGSPYCEVHAAEDERLGEAAKTTKRLAALNERIFSGGQYDEDGRANLSGSRDGGLGSGDWIEQQSERGIARDMEVE